MDNQHDIVNSVTQTVRDFLESNGILAPNSRITVGLSGGVDSVALLDILTELSREGNFTIQAAHLNHSIRPDADSDQEFCRNLCKKYNIEFHCEKVDAPKYAKDEGLSVEQAGRKLRYDFFEKVCRQNSSTILATAHHRGDNVETFLHHLFRGTHLRGASGIAGIRKMGASDITLIRPLLACDKQQLVQYCRAKNLSWREDSTNTDTDYTRNFIRHELLGLVKERVNPKADQAIGRFINAVRSADEFIKTQADEVLQTAIIKHQPDMIILDASVLKDQPSVIRTYVCRAALGKLKLPMRKVGFEDVESIAALIDSKHPSIVNLPCDASASTDRGNIIIKLKSHYKSFSPVELDPTGQTRTGDTIVTCRICDFSDKLKQEFVQRKSQGAAGSQWLDADKIEGKIIARPRKNGDQFTPLGQKGKKSVSDFLTDLKLPAYIRDEIMCICDDNGILCIGRFRTDERVKISDSTRRVMIIEFAQG